MLLSHSILSAQTDDHGAGDQPQTNTSTFSRGQILENWGWVLAHQKKLDGVELSDAERKLFLDGFIAGVSNGPAPAELQKIYTEVEQLGRARREKRTQAITKRNEAAAAVYLERLKTNAALTELPGQVWCQILRRGAATVPKLGQTVNVHYTAHLMDGTEFNQMGPIDLVLVTNHSVCRGWVDALQQIGAGGALKLYVPPPLSEDEAESFGIEPGSLMIFDVELFGITNTLPEDLANATLPPAPAPVPLPSSGCPESQVIETWGWTIARESHAGQYGLSDAEITALARGLSAGIRQQPSPVEIRKIYPVVEQFVADQQARVRLQARQAREAEMEALFAELKRNTNVVELPDGLRYEVLKPGTGPFPRPDQTVTVRYTGHLINGHVFDRTDAGPLDIDLDKVIRGWSEGVEKINAGGKIRLYIPPALGYRDEATSGIPPHSVLIFEIELLAVKNREP